MFDARRSPLKFASPGVSLAVALTATLLVMVFPAVTARFQSAANTALWPGQRAADTLRREIAALTVRVSDAFSSSHDLARARDEIEDLRFHNRKLEQLLAQARRDDVAENTGQPAAVESSPLLVAELIEARLLGRQARSFLAQREIIESGSSDRIQPGALVLSATPRLDAGRDGSIGAGDLVLAGRRIVGRVAVVGTWTSTLQRVTQPGYRDVVLLAAPDQPLSASAPRGILEGSGDALCRIRHIANSAPVSEGDLVYTAAAAGILVEPLIYGNVVRVAAAEDNAHWDIWMEPLMPAASPQNMAVLRARLNPRRLARKHP